MTPLIPLDASTTRGLLGGQMNFKVGISDSHPLEES